MNIIKWMVRKLDRATLSMDNKIIGRCYERCGPEMLANLSTSDKFHCFTWLSEELFGEETGIYKKTKDAEYIQLCGRIKDE